MSDEPFTQENLEVFAYYGRVMLSVQWLELVLTRLARLNEKIPKKASFERVWKRLEKQLKKRTVL